MQGAIYCGVPAANTAFKITTELLRTAGKLATSQSLAAPVRGRRIHTFSAPQLHVTVQGEGPPVVMSHALGLDVSMWDDLGGAPGVEVLGAALRAPRPWRLGGAARARTRSTSWSTTRRA
jgi:3-oxoadipate enol-lactonase